MRRKGNEMTRSPVIATLNVGINNLIWIDNRIQELRQKSLDPSRCFSKIDSDEIDNLYSLCAKLCDECGMKSVSQIAASASSVIDAYDMTVSETESCVYRLEIPIERMIDWFGEKEPKP